MGTVVSFSKLAGCLFGLNKIFDFQATICYCLSWFFFFLRDDLKCLSVYMFHFFSNIAAEELVIVCRGLGTGSVSHETPTSWLTRTGGRWLCASKKAMTFFTLPAAPEPYIQQAM